MLVSIKHRTELTYSDRISESVMELRMAPMSDSRQSLRAFGMAVGPSSPLIEHRDWMGNRVHQLSVVQFHERLVIEAHSAVEMHPKPLKLEEIHDPFPVHEPAHKALDFVRFQGPIVRDDRLDELVSALGLRNVTHLAEVLHRVTKGVLDRFEYKKGVTTASTQLNEVLDRGAGVCQDFAHLSIALYRHLGIPARYVSGYLDRRSGGSRELQTHAWVEVLTQSHGWVSIDPTHGLVADEQHIAVALGRSYADVPPNRGVYRGDAEEDIDVLVEIEEVKEVPRGLLAPRAVQLQVPTYRDGPRDHREAMDYQLEQQQQQQQ